MIRHLFFLFFILGSTGLYGQTVYVGVPHTKTIVNDYGESESIPLSKEEAAKFKVVLSVAEETLFWESRNRYKLCGDKRIPFYTFIAENGNGFIRITPESTRSALDRLANAGKEKNSTKKAAGYTEVIYNVQGLVIYQGFSNFEELSIVPSIMNCRAYNPSDKSESDQVKAIPKQ
jgi:hypothetical protein